MTLIELRKEVKKIIIAQNGEIYNYNLNNLKAAYGVDVTMLQNAVNYFEYSPQQAAFREKYNFH